MSGPPGLLLLRRYHLPAGSTTPAVKVRFPSQSPTTGFQPGPPKANRPASGAPGELLLRRYQVPAPGSNTPTVRAVGAPGVGGIGEGGVTSLAPVLMPGVPSTFPTVTGWASLWYCSGACVAAARVPTALASM